LKRRNRERDVYVGVCKRKKIEREKEKTGVKRGTLKGGKRGG
jgi:hypothetical protein